jgi:hypothetical protein
VPKTRSIVSKRAPAISGGKAKSIKKLVKRTDHEKAGIFHHLIFLILVLRMVVRKLTEDIVIETASTPIAKTLRVIPG